jgi:CPA2 family monovalent cation:H+ antiporter-2
MQNHTLIPQLIRDLAIVLAIAASVSIFFHRIRQPVVLGYIVSGIVASLALGSYSSELRTLADLGVIFLMFSLGLEFSFRKVAKLGPRVAFSALFEVAAVLAGGTLLTRVMTNLIGWPDPSYSQSAWLIGAMLAISSTTIIFKALDEIGLKTRRFAQTVLGMLVFEDLMAILLLVAAGAGQNTSVAQSLGTLILFIGGWFLFGTFVLPPLLGKIAKSNSEEMLMVVSVALCLGLGLAASSLGLSPGLGAFLMGSILAESTESHRIEKLIQPLRDLFVAVFFVSVGMLIEPRSIWDQKTVIIVLSLYVVLAKLLFVTLGSLLSGQTLKRSVLIAGSLTQIGEFSFLMAGAAITAQHLPPTVMPVIVTVSVLTTLITPYAIRWAPKIAAFAERSAPVRLSLLIDRYSSWSELRAAREAPQPQRRAAWMRWALSGFIVTLASRLANPYASPAVGLGVAILTSPFLWSFLRGIESAPRIETGPSRTSRLLTTGSQALSLLICGLLAWPFFRGTPVAWVVAVASVVLLVRLAGQLGLAFQWFEETFLATLSARKKKSARPPSMLLHKLAPWESQLVRLRLHVDSQFSGKTITETQLRNGHGINIVAIQRGSRLMIAPQPSQQLFPHDELLVLASEEQIERTRPLIELDDREPHSELENGNYELRAIEVTETSACARKTIRDSGVRDRYQALVVGIERDGRRIMNPDSETQIHPGDLLWVVGEASQLGSLSGGASPESQS